MPHLLCLMSCYSSSANEFEFKTVWNMEIESYYTVKSYKYFRHSWHLDLFPESVLSFAQTYHDLRLLEKHLMMSGVLYTSIRFHNMD